jgi:hypothetical protein
MMFESSRIENEHRIGRFLRAGYIRRSDHDYVN